MKERLINNLGLKILSIFLAFFVWLVVVNVSNPLERDTKEVPLEIVNDQVLLAANRTYEVSGKNTVTISYKVQTRDGYKIRSSDFRAYIDLADLYDVTGSVPVNVEILNNKELLREVEPRQSVVRVETEELQRKQFELSVKREEGTGEPAEGYALNGIGVDPAYVYVEGPISQVGQISHAGIEVNLEGLTEDYSGVAEPRFYDSNDNEIPLGKKVVCDTPEVTYNVTINREKKLPLDFEVSGTVAAGYQYVGAECATSTVAVVGLRTNLASINKITVPASELNLDGAMADRVVKINLKQYLPEGVQLAQPQNAEIEVRLKVERLVNKTFRLTEDDIARHGASDAYDYTLIPAQVDVTMQGLREDLESLETADLAATLNLSGMVPGRHKGILTFGADEAFKILSYTDFEVEVTLKGPGIVASESGESQSQDHTAAGESGESTEPGETGETVETTETTETAGPSSGTEENGQQTAAD